MAVKVTKKVKYATALYHKINATRSTFYMESFMLFSKSAHLLDYAALLSRAIYVRYIARQKPLICPCKVLNSLIKMHLMMLGCACLSFYGLTK